jgi:integrase
MQIEKYITVHLKTRKVKGHSYYYLYWQDPNWEPGPGKKHPARRRSLGNTKHVSKRQAQVVRSETEAAVNSNRMSAMTAGRGPRLSEFAEKFLIIQKSKLASGTLELYSQTIAYLLTFFQNDPPIGRISAQQAALFRAALADGKLKHITSRKLILSEASVDLNARNARAMFNKAIDLGLIADNPFRSVPQKVKGVKSWYYVSPSDFASMLEACPNLPWRLLLSLCRKAGLRSGEAMSLEFADIDFERHILTVIAKDDWQPKDKEPRRVPIEMDLFNLILEAHQSARDGQKKIIEGISHCNLNRDLKVICRRAGVEKYSKPFHTLRKNCITDWAAYWPAHVVKEWAGHADMETTNKHYLQVSESEYNRASNVRLLDVSRQPNAQLFAQPAENTEVNSERTLAKVSDIKDLKRH